MRALLLALMLLSIALAGCADSGDDDSTDGADDSDTTGGGGTDPGTGGNDESEDSGSTDPITYDATEVAFYLASDGLQLAVPADGTIPLVGAASMFGVGDIADAEFASREFGLPMLIAEQDVSATVWLQTDAVGIGNPAFDLAVWVGTSKGGLAFGFLSNVALQPGDAQEFTLDLNVRHDAVIPAGESVTTRILGMYQPDGAGAHNIAIGESTPSGLTLTMQPLGQDIPSEGTEQLLSESGQLSGGTFAECDAGETIHRFTVPEDAQVIDIVLEAASAAPGGPADVDLDLYDGSTVIWHAGSPYTDEQIFVAGPALEPYLGKELGVGTSICLGPVADYTVTVHSDVAAAA